ncbi:MAG TPA: hypothetical protein VGK67_39590 [Myxococcales bacterium]|jgi:hypothetical protein
MNQARLVKILVFLFGLPILGTGLWYSLKKEAKFQNELSRTQEAAPQLAELHRQAAKGTLKMLGPEGLEMSLIGAGFPPKKPMPSLKPRARLVGGAVGDAGRLTVAVVHYTAEEGRFTLFTIPADKEFLPEDATPVKRRGRTLQMVKRDGVTLVFWKSGFWYTALATEMKDGDRDLFVEQVLATQG